MSEYDAMCKEWLSDTGYVYGGGIISIADGNLYATSSADDIYLSEYDAQILGLDGTTMVDVHINEPQTFQETFATGRPQHGLWFGGEKYTVVQKREMENRDVILAAKKHAGMVLACTANGYAVMALYSEDMEQNKVDACSCALSFAEFLDTQGF